MPLAVFSAECRLADGAPGQPNDSRAVIVGYVSVVLGRGGGSPQRGQASGSTSKIRRSHSAQRRRASLRASGLGLTHTLGCSSPASVALRRMPLTQTHTPPNPSQQSALFRVRPRLMHAFFRHSAAFKISTGSTRVARSAGR